MYRRTFLAATGLAGVAGCLGSTGSSPEGTATQTDAPTDAPTDEPTDTPGSINDDESDSSEGPMNGDDLPSDDEPDDGLPPEFDSVPEERSIDTGSYEELSDGVLLAPIEDVYYWYARREARFVDARSGHEYGKSHVFGAVSSPANKYDQSSFDDPADGFPKDEPVVCYCGCPHHLSGLRASGLVEAGYEEVYVLDDGYWEWQGSEFPVAGDDTDRTPTAMVIRGEADPASAGEAAWARHQPTGQAEATDIRSDGTYEMTLRFHDVSARSPIAIETPDYEVERSLGELTGTVVSGLE